MTFAQQFPMVVLSAQKRQQLGSDRFRSGDIATVNRSRVTEASKNDITTGELRATVAVSHKVRECRRR